MAASILQLFATAFNAASIWFTSLFQRSQMLGVYLGAIALHLMIRFILLPLFRGSGSGSDKVKHPKETSDKVQQPKEDS